VKPSYAAPIRLLSIVGLLLQLSCGDRVGKAALPPEEKSAVRTASAKATVDIFLDASDSMSGFLAESTDGPKNYYRDVLGRLADVITARANTEVRQWRFGKGTPRELGPDASIGRSFRDFILRPSLFNDTRTDIDEVVRFPGTKVTEGAHVKILITDLFQNAGDVGKLANEFNERYLKGSENAVVIVGIRSAFRREITDLRGRDGKPLPAKAADSFPFYIIVAGPVGDVDSIVATLKERFPVTASSIVVTFARSVTPQLDRRMVVKAVRSGESKSPGFSQSRLVERAQQRGIPQVQLTRGRQVTLRLEPPKEAASEWPLSGDVITAPLGPAFKRTAKLMPLEINGWAAASKSANPKAAGDAVRDAFEYDPKAGYLKINSGRLTRGTVYLVRLDFSAEKGDFKALEEWSLDETAPVTETMFESKDGRTRPGRTLNLIHFLNTLADRLFQEDVPLARYYLYAVVK